MSGRLYLVATPIGHLGDITYRAVETLKEVDLIYCEDTRHSQPLLNHYKVTTPLKVLHEHNEDKMQGFILKQLEAGKNIAIISDAGMPLISDPGFKLTRDAKDVTVLPGASAVLTALLLSRFPTDKFIFMGFLPEKKEKRHTLLLSVKALKMTLIFFVPPHDAAKTAKAISEALGNREACLARELTKKFEESLHGQLDDLAETWITTPPKGECVLLVRGAEVEQQSLEFYEKELLELMSTIGTKKAAAEIAELSGYPKSEVYRYALDLAEKT